jgi:hypothetical protein
LTWFGRLFDLGIDPADDKGKDYDPGDKDSIWGWPSPRPTLKDVDHGSMTRSDWQPRDNQRLGYWDDQGYWHDY